MSCQTLQTRGFKLDHIRSKSTAARNYNLRIKIVIYYSDYSLRLKRITYITLQFAATLVNKNTLDSRMSGSSFR